MTEQQPIAVLGGGSFGTAIANLLAENGQQVRLWMRDSEQAEAPRSQCPWMTCQSGLTTCRT